jgi:hypothetical protein
MKIKWTDFIWNDFLGETILGELILGEMILGELTHTLTFYNPTLGKQPSSKPPGSYGLLFWKLRIVKIIKNGIENEIENEKIALRGAFVCKKCN